MVSCNNDSDSLAPTPIAAVWGKLSAIKQRTITIVGPDTVITTSELAIGEFISDTATPGILANAGNVTLNSIELTRNSNNQYLKSAASGQTPSSLDLDNNMEWHVTGMAAVPPISYKDMEDFPSYTPALPYTISKSAGISLMLDSTTVIGADSVRVLVDDAQGHLVQKIFGAKAGSIAIESTLLAPLTIVTDQTAVIAIMPYGGIVKPFRNRGIHFIRERRFYQSVFITN